MFVILSLAEGMVVLRNVLNAIYNIKLKWLLALMLAFITLLAVAMNIIYYFVSSNSLEVQAQAYFSNVCSNLEYNINAVNDNTKKIVESICNLKEIQNYLATGNDIDMHKNIVNTALKIISLNEYLETIKIFSNQGFTISAAANDPVAGFSIQQKYGLPNSNISKPFFSETYISYENKNVYYAYIYPIRSIDLDSFGDNLGSAEALINLDNVFAQDSIADYTRSATCLVLDDSDNIIFNMNITDDAKAFLDACMSKNKGLTSKVSKISYNRTPYFFSISSIPELDLRILVAIPQNELGSQTEKLGFFTICLTVISVFILVLIAAMVMRSIYRPIQSMAQDMSKVRVGERNLRINIPTKNELGSLADSINNMLDELNTTMRKIVTTQEVLYETELAQKKSEMIALQSQINPHFLYNTLNCIQSIALENQLKDIATITSCMAKIYRYSIGENNAATLKDELGCVNDYLKIMRIRFQCSARLEVDVPDDLLNASIMRMSLQPIVENAFTHGLEKVHGNGFIKITAFTQGEHLVITVTNSGKTLKPQQAQEINDKLRNDTFLLEDYNINGGIALVNINRRLCLSGKPGCGLFVSVTDDGYSCFKLVFPNSQSKR